MLHTSQPCSTARRRAMSRRTTSTWLWSPASINALAENALAPRSSRSATVCRCPPCAAWQSALSSPKRTSAPWSSSSAQHDVRLHQRARIRAVEKQEADIVKASSSGHLHQRLVQVAIVHRHQPLLALQLARNLVDALHDIAIYIRTAPASRQAMAKPRSLAAAGQAGAQRWVGSHVEDVCVAEETADSPKVMKGARASKSERWVSPEVTSPFAAAACGCGTAGAGAGAGEAGAPGTP